jgi:hypothetical protein
MPKKRINKVAGMLFLTAVIVLVVLPVVTAFFLFENRPYIYETRAIEVQDAGRVKVFVQRIVGEITSKKHIARVSAKEEELNALIAFADRTIQGFSGHIRIENFGMVMVATFKVPENPFGHYLNSRIYLVPSDAGLKIRKWFIGKVQIPSTAAHLFLRVVLNTLLGNGQGSDVLDSIQKVSFQDREITIELTPMTDIRFRFNLFKNRMKTIRDNFYPSFDVDLVKLYYEKLIEIEGQFQPGQAISLSRYLSPLFELANQRSKPGTHVRENRAAILALSVYAGHWRFEQFTGDVGSKHISPNPLITRNIVLGGRQDLRLHFIVSAGIKVIADSGVSFIAGEFKELMDALYGGSGFSFADLAADRAGTFFAQMAVSNDTDAEKLQQGIMENPEETYFFPDVLWLPEGISQERFQQEFKHVESDQYQALINAIDQQIMHLGLYH